MKEYAWVPLYGPAPVDESVALMVKLAAPPAVGVPVIAPVVALSERPSGNDPAETVKLYGAVPPLPVTVCE